MESLILGCKVIIPLIIYMGLGYFFRQIRLARETTFRELNKICFRCFLPVMLFYNIYQSDLKADFDPHVLVYAVICVAVMYTAAILVVNACFRGSFNRSVVIQGIYRSNFVLFGMEVTRTICGEDQMGMASILVAIIIPIFNVLTVVLFEFYGSAKKSKKKVLIGIAKNPLIIASVLGIIVKMINVVIPTGAEDIISTIGKMATPVALLCLGGTFVFARVAVYRKELLFACIGRLVVVPLIFISLAVALGFRGSNLVALMVMLACPTAVSSFNMASEMNGNGELAGMIVVFTSLFSIITMFLWVAVLHAFGLIVAG